MMPHLIYGALSAPSKVAIDIRAGGPEPLRWVCGAGTAIFRLNLEDLPDIAP